MSRPPSYRSGSYGSGTAASRVPLPVKSIASSKEAQFDADSDDLDDEDDMVAIAASSLTTHGQGAVEGHHRRAPGHHRERSGSLPLIDRIPNPFRASLDGLGNDLRHLRENLSAVGVPGWDGEGLPDWLKRGAGVFDATVNMANSILGAGIVGLPYSMRESGFVAGLGLLIGLSFLTDWTIRLIVLNAKLSGRITYIEIMEHCFGGNGKAAVSIFQFAFAFGGMCAFCVVIGDTIPHVIRSLFPALAGTFLANRQFVITFFTMAISYPLSLYRNIESLSKASAIALVSMVVIIVAVTLRGPAMPIELKGDPSLRFTVVNVSNLVRSISVISFAFVCHHNSLLIYGSLKEPSMNKFGQVTHYSTIIAAAATITMSVAGYWSFEEKTLSNVLNNFPDDDTFINVARGLFGLNMLTTLPLECFVCREVLETYFFAGEFDRNRHLIFTSSLVVSAMMVSLLTCDLGIVLELTGGLSATALAFIFPSLCYLKLSGESGKKVPLSSVPNLGSAEGQPSRSAPRANTAARAGGADHEGEGGAAGAGGVITSYSIHIRSIRDPSRENRIRIDDYESDDEDDGGATLDDLEAPGLSGAGSHGPSHLPTTSRRPGAGEVPIEDVELPLRPGATVRFRPPASKRKWWQSTRPLSVACAVFGMVVLVISVWTAITDVAAGRSGAVHVC
ncbi:uncharacterized protein PFL1_02513 [Pseudozyma flocculosa PF-1]|uniref:Amino acid transporter transmembrane domain-containing protein n=1 Tax=Pseudozyma flocculosa PF-1 TaxID=1277687 RepID=A0A061HCS6_9BASI|nr:uncharacterized protein PFL1_02513 [Pseudozyma flocculosa PF-1]EPQ29840.1 hypothetical protein PFL1_02513 [Pseudozyma flocculosa PF-1]